MRPVIFALLAAFAVPAAASPEPAVKNCLNLKAIDSTRIVDNRTVYYRERSTWYRNDLRVACPGLRKQSALTNRSQVGQLCLGDLVTVLEPQSGTELGSCTLGSFTAADPPPSR